MTKDEIIDELISRKHVVKLGVENYQLTNNLSREVKEEKAPKKEKKGVPLLAPREVLKKFIKDSKIPFMAKTSTGQRYQLNIESDYAAKTLFKIMAAGTYTYEDMVNATCAYYNNVSLARVTLTNYFKQGVIDAVVSDYLQNSESLTKDSSAPKSNSTLG